MSNTRYVFALLGAVSTGVAATLAAGQEKPATTPDPTPVQALRAEADTLKPLVTTDLARQFLQATADLPAIEQERVVYWDRATRRALTPREAAELSPEELEAFNELSLGEQFYDYTAYGTPLAYCRALDLAAAAGFDSADGKRVVDFGFGGIGHLRLLASLGAHVTGIEVLDLLCDFYREPGDTGVIGRSGAAEPGSPGTLSLVYGSFPGDATIAEVVGGNCDLFISKNVLKKGYVHPQREADPRFLVHLGAARAMGRALGWGESMDLESDLFGMYTILRKPSA